MITDMAMTCDACKGDTRQRGMVITTRGPHAGRLVPGRLGIPGSCYTCQGRGVVRLHDDGTQIRERAE